MTRNTDLFQCNCQLSRRRFLSGCAASAAFAAFSALKSTSAAIATPSIPTQKARIRLVFTHQPPEDATWPNIGYDYENRKNLLTQNLRQACPNIDFLPATAINTDEAKKLLDSDANIDGYVVYMLGLWTGAPQVIAESGRPTVYVDDLYGGSGEFLTAYASARRNKLKVTGVSSSRFQDVGDAVNCFDCLKKLLKMTGVFRPILFFFFGIDILSFLNRFVFLDKPFCPFLSRLVLQLEKLTLKNITGRRCSRLPPVHGSRCRSYKRRKCFARKSKPVPDPSDCLCVHRFRFRKRFT